MTRTFSVLTAAFLLYAAAAECQDPPHQAPNARTAVYTQEATLQEALLAARPRYHSWLEEQPAIRQSVTLGSWLRTAPLTQQESETVLTPRAADDFDAKRPDGKPLWTAWPDLSDAKVTRLPSASGRTVLGLARLIQAPQSARLTVGMGGGDRIEVWLNGQPVGQADTLLTRGRYGSSHRVDGTRVDQFLVDLDLQPGDNRLLVRVTSSDDPSFYFSPSPDPLPKLWHRAAG